MNVSLIPVMRAQHALMELTATHVFVGQDKVVTSVTCWSACVNPPHVKMEPHVSQMMTHFSVFALLDTWENFAKHVGILKCSKNYMMYFLQESCKLF